jgi:hypothetical protein
MGQVKPLFSMPKRTRFLLSLTEESGRPTIVTLDRSWTAHFDLDRIGFDVDYAEIFGFSEHISEPKQLDF